MSPLLHPPFPTASTRSVSVTMDHWIGSDQIGRCVFWFSSTVPQPRRKYETRLSNQYKVIAAAAAACLVMSNHALVDWTLERDIHRRCRHHHCAASFFSSPLTRPDGRCCSQLVHSFFFILLLLIIIQSDSFFFLFLNFHKSPLMGMAHCCCCCWWWSHHRCDLIDSDYF